MGSLGHTGIDGSLGGLVWVRRRNGRWWPGQILGPEELPDPPKPGTAIKLLGRDDDSVDWYNVEKSTHVKAFRCGEYHECIEKAEVTATNRSKKIVKYASKEDAIHHALEIERACLGKDHPTTNSRMTNQGHEVEDSPRSFHRNKEEINNGDEDFSDSEIESDSAQGLSFSGVSFQDPSYTGAYKENIAELTSNESDNDGTEGVKHMEGLHNLRTPVITSSKRKRFQVAHVHDFLKRKHRCRTVTKIPESKIMVTVPVVYEKLAHPTRSLPRGASNRKVSRQCSDVPKINFPLKDNDGSSDYGLYDVPIVTQEQHCAGILLVNNTSERGHVSDGTTFNESSQVKTLSSGESDSTSSGTAEVNDIIQLVDNGFSKWKLKRKRSRHTNKNLRLDLQKFTDVYDEFDAYVAGAECSVDHNTNTGSSPSDNSTHPLMSRAIADIKIDEDRGWSANTSHANRHGSRATAELLAQQRWIPHRESHFSMNSTYQDYLIGHHCAEYFLFDVNLEVKANYRPQQVPFVSLTSKLTGQSIIGHPLAVEVLEYGFCDNLVTESGCYSSSCELDEELGETSSALQIVMPSKSTNYVLSKKLGNYLP